jgi:hypothetical protein
MIVIFLVYVLKVVTGVVEVFNNTTSHRFVKMAT